MTINVDSHKLNKYWSRFLLTKVLVTTVHTTVATKLPNKKNCNRRKQVNDNKLFLNIICQL